MAGENKAECRLNIFLTGSELRAESGDVGGGLGISLLEGSLVNVAGEHRIFDGSVLGGETSDLSACAGTVLGSVLVADSAGTVDLAVGQQAFLSVDTGLILDLEGACLLLLPAGTLLQHCCVEAFNDNTALFAAVTVPKCVS